MVCHKVGDNILTLNNSKTRQNAGTNYIAS